MQPTTHLSNFSRRAGYYRSFSAYIRAHLVLIQRRQGQIKKHEEIVNPDSKNFPRWVDITLILIITILILQLDPLTLQISS